MKAITVIQPWATLIAVGAKQILSCSWTTSYRGPIAIHAATLRRPGERALCDGEPFRSALIAGGVRTRTFYGETSLIHADLPRGAIVAVAELSAIYRAEEVVFGLDPGAPFPKRGETWLATRREKAFGDYAPGRFAWILDDIRRLPVPVPARGGRGIWGVDGDVARQILDHLAAAAR